MTAEAARLGAANLALAHLGEPPVETLALDDTSEMARKLLPFLDMARDLVLGRHGWRRALAYVTLEDSGEAGDWRFPYVLHLPGDALRVWRVDPAQGGADWEAGTRALEGEERLVVRSSAASLNVAYVRRLGWDGLPERLIEPIAALAASRTAGAGQGDPGKAQALAREYEKALAAAVTADGTEAGGGSLLVEGRLAAARRVG